jgi:hypothetical protein
MKIYKLNADIFFVRTFLKWLALLNHKNYIHMKSPRAAAPVRTARPGGHPAQMIIGDSLPVRSGGHVTIKKQQPIGCALKMKT